jgi:hypothetical protein
MESRALIQESGAGIQEPGEKQKRKGRSFPRLPDSKIH